MLREAASQTKYCCSLKVKILNPDFWAGYATAFISSRTNACSQIYSLAFLPKLQTSYTQAWRHTGCHLATFWARVMERDHATRAHFFAAVFPARVLWDNRTMQDSCLFTPSRFRVAFYRTQVFLLRRVKTKDASLSSFIWKNSHYAIAHPLTHMCIRTVHNTHDAWAVLFRVILRLPVPQPHALDGFFTEVPLGALGIFKGGLSWPYFFYVF